MKKFVTLTAVAALALGAAACSKTEANNTADANVTNEVAPVEGNLTENTVDANATNAVETNATDANATNAVEANSTNAN